MTEKCCPRNTTPGGVQGPSGDPQPGPPEGSQPARHSLKRSSAQTWVPKTLLQESGPGLPVEAPESGTRRGKFTAGVEVRAAGRPGAPQSQSRS